MEEKKNQKKKVMILVLVLGLVLLTIGGTYAFFTYSRQGVEEHVLTTGSLYFVYDELQDQEGNQISIGNAFPVSDENGIEQEKPGMFEFEVRAKNQGVDINYEIYLTKDESSTLPEKVVDTYLTTTGKKGENSADTLVEPTWDNKWTKDNGVTQYQFLWNSHVPVLEEGQQGKSLYQEKIPSTNGEEYSKIFRYRMWLDESANDVNAKGEWIYGGKSFTVRVNVYASNEELPSPTPVGVMQSWTFNMEAGNLNEMFPNTDFHTIDKIFSIRNIKFENKIEIPESVSKGNQWDISEKKDKSVMAYMIPNDEGETCQDIMNEDGGTIPCNDIVIASNGETYGNPDSSWAFSWFMSLKNIDFTNYNASLVEDVGAMFYECEQLISLDLGLWGHVRLNNISYVNVYGESTGMFDECTSLTNVGDLSAWDTSGVTNMSYMFHGCSQLSDFSFLEHWDVSNVKNMADMFSGCSQLTTITGIENWDTPNVMNMSFMFGNCSQLTSLDLSNWETISVTDMSSMFYGCSQLSTIRGIENWHTSSVTDMDYMFFDCSELSDLNLSGWNTSNVIDMYSMFNGCSKLSTVGDLSGWNTSNVSNINNIFKDCNQLSNLDLSSWDVSHVTNMDGMFWGCSQLQSLDLSDWDTSSVTDMSEMFSGCSQLIELDISNFDFSSIDVIHSSSYENMFSNTNSLIAIYVNETEKDFLLLHINDVGLTGRENLLQTKA